MQQKNKSQCFFLAETPTIIPLNGDLNMASGS